MCPFMKQVKKRLCGVLALVMCFSTLTACAANPNRGSVTSKNDGVFEQNMTIPATAPLDEEIVYTDTFTSHDGTVEYVMDLQQQITSDPLPIVEVVPHFFTGEEVKRICNVLLGDVEWREQVHEDDPQYSKEELQKKIRWMTELANESAIRELLGFGPDYDCTDELDILKGTMQYYTVMLETAPEENPRPLCDWTFQDESLYVSPSYGNKVIHATAYIEDSEYYVYVVQRDKSDYKLNSLSIGLGNNRDYLNKNYLCSKLVRTDKPTQEQVNQLSEKAQSLLNQMGVGQWQVSDAEVSEELCGDTSEYRVMINAVPVLNDTAAISDQPIENLTSEDANASNYHTASASIYFSTNGDLIYFDMVSPVDISAVVNEGAATLSMEELLSKAKDHLALTGIEETWDYYLLSIYYETPVTCKIELDQVQLGLVRVKAANKDFTYYYTPTLAVYGTTKYYDKGTDNEVDSFVIRDPDKSRCLVWINAVDGSIIGAS